MTKLGCTYTQPPAPNVTFFLSIHASPPPQNEVTGGNKTMGLKPLAPFMLSKVNEDSKQLLFM